MKTLAAILLAASLSSLAACTDDVSPDPQGPGLPPLGKPESNPDSIVAEGVEDSVTLGTTQVPQKGIDDGRLEWAETIGTLTYIHRVDGNLGIDEIAILDEHGELHCCFTPRDLPTEISHTGVK